MQDLEFIKYLNRTANNSEQKKVENWILATEQNSKYFNELKALYIASTFDETSENIELEKGYNTFTNTIRSVSITRNRKFIPALKYAAMITIIFGTGYFFINDFFKNESIPIISDEVITLLLGNGDIKIISEKSNAKILNKNGMILGFQTGNTINYKNTKSKESLTYNTLFVPYGKRFELILSDGTKVMLNAGTSLKYPVQFIKNQNRQVFLNGEAYFDVTKDEEHPFVVNVNEINVRVLGTQFNISNYHEDSNINTILVEGSVILYELGNEKNPESSIYLAPGYKAEWNKTKKEMSVTKVDQSIYTAWRNGVLLFENVSFENIHMKLERHFNISIENQYNLLNCMSSA